MAKKMNFIYYRPVLAATGQLVKLNAYFQKIVSNEKKYETSLSSSLTNIQLHEIKHHEEYKLGNNVICKAPLWELRFFHKRIDVPGVVNEDSNTINAVKVSSNQKIAEVTVVIYDTTTDIVIINKTQSGVSDSKVAAFINYFIEDPKDAIIFDVLTDSKIIEEVKKKEIYTSISTRLLTMGNTSLDSHTNNLKSKSLLSVIHSFLNSETPQEFAATIRYDISINAKDKKAHLNKNETRCFIGDIKKLIKENLVGSCILKAKDTTDGRIKTFNLLKYIIKDTHSFEITDKNRYITEEAISQAIVLEYNSNKRNKFLEGKF